VTAEHPLPKIARGLAEKPSLCLNLIVKNEAAIVDRLVASVSPYVSHYVVCDTGSTDDTAERIRAGFAARGVPGEIHAIPFETFGRSRNEALARGRSSPGRFDYFLLADADMELIADDATFAAALEAPAYLVRQRAGTSSYYNVRLLRRDARAAYVGATHEYLGVEGAVERLSGIEFLDHACGANRGDKAARDIRLLRAALAENPRDARAMFYLAQTYKDTGRYAEAALWYEARIQAGGFAEESWYARYQLALCCAQLDDETGFVEECERAYAERPWRAEPLHALANHYRRTGRPDVALSYAEAAQQLPYPEQDILFVDDSVYPTAPGVFGNSRSQS
jgi:glycosyltransferase involved in cell wall biosynthesis